MWQPLLNPQHNIHLADTRFSLAEVCHFAGRLQELELVLKDFNKSKPEPSLTMASKFEQLAEIAFIRFGSTKYAKKMFFPIPIA